MVGNSNPHLGGRVKAKTWRIQLMMRRCVSRNFVMRNNVLGGDRLNPKLPVFMVAGVGPLVDLRAEAFAIAANPMANCVSSFSTVATVAPYANSISTFIYLPLFSQVATEWTSSSSVAHHRRRRVLSGSSIQPGAGCFCWRRCRLLCALRHRRRFEAQVIIMVVVPD
jgi:hypothetical protein